MTWQPPELKGTRFVADASLRTLIEYACLPLVTPFRQQAPDWMMWEYYKIDAVVPPGTSVDATREMLRTALIQRLGLRYHITDQETPVYHLVRGSGPLRLQPSTGPVPPGGYAGTTWAFRSKSADISRLASFLGSVAGRDVIDKTGIQGNFEFNLDWSNELHNLQSGPRMEGFGVASSGIAPLGLKLESGKELRRILIVDGANKKPTAN